MTGCETPVREAERLLLKEDYEGFIQAISALAEGELSPAALHNLAVAHYKIGDFSRARALLTSLVRKGQCGGRSYYALGLVERDSGEYKKALRAFREALRRQPGLAFAHVSCGVCHFRLGDPKQAAADFQTATQLADSLVTAHYNHAVARVALEEWDAARRAFARCMELDPPHKDEYLGLICEIGRAQAFAELYADGHRIKNTLGVIGSQLQMLYKRFAEDLPPAFRKPLEESLANHERIYASMAAHLAHMSIPPLEFDLADPHEILDAALIAADGAMGNVRLERRYDQTVGDLVCEASLLREAFLNVVLNAYDAMTGRPSGLLVIETRRSQAGEICVTIADNGCGVSALDLPHVFRYGFTTKEFGSGLGLSQAKRAIERHGGTIEIESREGEGTLVRVVLLESPPVERSLAMLRVRSSVFEDPSSLVVSEEVSAEELMVDERKGP
ncbi:MAG: ATP-binding protein [Planctomycetota bacterium]